MPWDVRVRGDEWCVFKTGEDKPVGCHASRDRAVSQQQALYAQESELTASAEQNGAVKLEIAQAADSVNEALVAAVQAVTERLAETEGMLAETAAALARVAEAAAADRSVFMDALTAAASRPAPEVTVHVPAAEVTVNVPVPEVTVTTPAPIVNVPPPAAAKQKRRRITLKRDPMGALEEAEIEDV